MSARPGRRRRRPPDDRARRQGSRGPGRLPRRPAAENVTLRSRFSIDRRGRRAREDTGGSSARPRGFGVVEIARAAPTGTRWQKRESDVRRGRKVPAALRRGDARERHARRQHLEAGQERERAGPWSALAPLLTEDARGGRARRRPGRPRRRSRTSRPTSRRSARSASAAARPRRAPTYGVVAVTDVAHARREARMGIDRPRHVLGARAPRRARSGDARPEARPRAPCRQPSRRRGAARPADLAEVLKVVEGVRASPLWKRALAVEATLVEVPFALPVEP